MPRSQSPAPSRSRQPSANRADATRESTASPLDDSPRMVAQRERIRSLFGPMGDAAPQATAAGGVVQGFFDLHGQPTNDEERFADGIDQEEKERQIWGVLKPEVEAAWKKLPDPHFTEGLAEEYRAKLLELAFSPGKVTLRAAASTLENIAARRIRDAQEREAEIAEAGKPLEDRPSPAGVGGTLNTTPALSGKEKHSTATYTRTTPAGEGGGKPVVSPESFASDDYTKGPAKRSRAGPQAPVTTPAGTRQAWTRKQIEDSIGAWPCNAPLARHLARTVWPHLANTDEGRKWELKFREIDRLIAFRDAEGQSRSIEIWKKVPKEKIQSLDRHTYNKRARQALKEDLLKGTRHPADQQDVLFYDALLRADVSADLLAAGPAFALKPAYMAVGEGGLSMILTHWRPILFFDWILAEDVLNNAS